MTQGSKRIAAVDGKPWYVDVRSLRAGEVALELHPKQVVRIRAAGNTYTVL
jgi:hypothetical protein